ncbi:hypothetical protein niasHT_016252 [Heterodera trifolii]|uniref:Uncharacterized protein n=1 Tax=Heterodera trifolii TaxID=157864 RepID=A0ABD2LJ11_9BILA
MPIRFLSMLFPLLVLLVNVPSTLPWMLERDGVLLAYDPNNYNAETWADWGLKVGGSAIAGGIAGSGIPVIGTIIGFFGGATIAASEFAINKLYCQNACGKQYVVCTQSKGASMACCNSDFACKCVNDFNEVEAMFPTTTTTTTTPTPAPIHPTVVD